jgi:hypothetical protein
MHQDNATAFTCIIIKKPTGRPSVRRENRSLFCRFCGFFDLKNAEISATRDPSTAASV